MFLLLPFSFYRFNGVLQALLERFIFKEEDPVLTLVFRFLFFLEGGVEVSPPSGSW